MDEASAAPARPSSHQSFLKRARIPSRRHVRIMAMRLKVVRQAE